MVKNIIRSLVVLFVVLGSANLSFAQEAPLPDAIAQQMQTGTGTSNGDLTKPDGRDFSLWWLLLIPLVLFAVYLLYRRWTKPTAPPQDTALNRPDPRPRLGHESDEPAPQTTRDTRTVRVDREHRLEHLDQPRQAGAEHLRAVVVPAAAPAAQPKPVAPPAVAAAAVVIPDPAPAAPAADLDLAALDEANRTDRTEPAAAPAAPTTTVTTSTTVVQPAPAADSAPVAPAPSTDAAPAATGETAAAAASTSEGGNAPGTARTITAVIAAILLSGVSALAQTAPPSAYMVTKVEPNVVMSGSTTTVNVTCNAACMPAEVQLGATAPGGTGTGMTARNIQKTSNGFTMDVVTTSVKTDGWTRWAIMLQNTKTWLLVPQDQALYAMGKPVVDQITSTATTTVNSALKDVDKRTAAQIAAATKNLTARDPQARRNIDTLNGSIRTLETQLTSRIDEVAASVDTKVDTSQSVLQEQINVLVKANTALTQTVNAQGRQIEDLSRRQVGDEQLAPKQNAAIEAINNALNASKRPNRYIIGSTHTVPDDEREKVDAAVTALLGRPAKPADPKKEKEEEK